MNNRNERGVCIEFCCLGRVIDGGIFVNDVVILLKV